MSSQLDSRIETIVQDAAVEIARAVRGSIASEVAKVLASSGRAQRARVQTAARKPVRRRGRRRTVSPAQLKTVLDYINKNPGKRGEHIRAALQLSTDVGGRILAKLRQTKAVKTRGEKRLTTYTAA